MSFSICWARHHYSSIFQMLGFCLPMSREYRKYFCSRVSNNKNANSMRIFPRTSCVQNYFIKIDQSIWLLPRSHSPTHKQTFFLLSLSKKISLAHPIKEFILRIHTMIKPLPAQWVVTPDSKLCRRYERQVDGKVQTVLNINKICRLQKRDLEFTTNHNQIDKIQYSHWNPVRSSMIVHCHIIYNYNF